MSDLANCPDCGHHPISRSAKTCPHCGCTVFVKPTGNSYTAPCGSCVGYPHRRCEECFGTGITTWVEWKDFRSGRIDHYIRGIDPNLF